MNKPSLHPGERLILPTDPHLQYTGRIDDENPDAPIFQYVCSSIRVRVASKHLKLLVTNIHSYWENRLGIIVDGKQTAVLLPDQGDAAIDLTPLLHEGINDVLVFKRQDSCHAFIFHGFAVDEDVQLEVCPPKPQRRMEFYGDSVTAGEVSEALDCAGKPDPEHVGQYSNGWWSYAWQTARMLGAQIHDIAQGGIALQDGCGYFNDPQFQGMLSCYDKVSYNPCLGPVKPWDFTRYTPQVVVLAIGQNDAHPDNYMESDYAGEKATKWRADYRGLIEQLRARYPKATIILTTTILNHARQWDDAIDQVCRELRETDSRVYHFLYEKNGCGTPGHIRAGEAEGMARELSGFIRGLGEAIWE